MGETTLQALAILALPALIGFAAAWLLRGHHLRRRVAGAESALAAAQRACDDLKRVAAAAEGRLATLDAERRAAEAAHSAQVSRLRLELAATRRAKTELLTALEVEVRQAKQAYDQRLTALTAELAQLRAGGADKAPSGHRVLAMPSASAAPAANGPGGQRPAALPQADGAADDLKKIHGVGPKLERNLNQLGIYHYRQIADLTAENVAWINSYLKVRGRIERQNWVAQARVLAGKPVLLRPVGAEADDAN